MDPRHAPESATTRFPGIIRFRLPPTLLCAALIWPNTAAGQTHRDLRWWHPLAARAGAAVLLAMDEPARDFLQDHRSATLDDLAGAARRLHDPRVFFAAGVGAMSVGLMARELAIAETGVQILVAYGLSAGAVIATKWVLGRSRPNNALHGSTHMDWFHGGAESAFPSGAAATTFSLATVLADAIGHGAITIPLYGAATLNAWSRTNDNVHWLELAPGPSPAAGSAAGARGGVPGRRPALTRKRPRNDLHSAVAATTLRQEARQ